MNVIVSDCPSTLSRVSHAQAFAEQIQSTWFGPAAAGVLDDRESRQDLLSQLAMLDAELRDQAEDRGANERERMREELLTYLRRLAEQLDVFHLSPKIAARVEQGFCEFAELLYDYDLAASSS